MYYRYQNIIMFELRIFSTNCDQFCFPPLAKHESFMMPVSITTNQRGRFTSTFYRVTHGNKIITLLAKTIREINGSFQIRIQCRPIFVVKLINFSNHSRNRILHIFSMEEETEYYLQCYMSSGNLKFAKVSILFSSCDRNADFIVNC